MDRLPVCNPATGKPAHPVVHLDNAHYDRHSMDKVLRVQVRPSMIQNGCNPRAASMIDSSTRIRIIQRTRSSYRNQRMILNLKFLESTMVEERKHEESTGESLLEKIVEKIHGHGDSSSLSDSDDDRKSSSSSSSFKSNIYRLFGREIPVHKVLGGGKPADIFLWRNKKVSGGVFGTVTACWVVFELAEYHLLTFLCHFSMIALAALFLWSNACTFIHKATPHIQKVHIPEDPVLQLVSGLRIEINRGLLFLGTLHQEEISRNLSW